MPRHIIVKSTMSQELFETKLVETGDFMQETMQRLFAHKSFAIFILGLLSLRTRIFTINNDVVNSLDEKLYGEECIENSRF